MNVSKTLFSGLVGIGMLLGTAGCDGFLDINTDPDAATAVPGALLFPTVIADIGSTRAIEVGPAASSWSQQWSSNLTNGAFANPERYNVSRTLINNFWLTNYTNALKNLGLLIDQSETTTPARPNEAAQAKILSAFIYYQTTIVFGDIPFSEALQPVDFPNPKFDAQRDVLLGIIDLADEGINQIVASDANKITRGDVIYEGDLNKWIKFGNSVKLQANMLLRGGGENRDAEIDALIANPNLIRTNADNAVIPFNDQTANPYARLLNLYPFFYNFYFGGKPLVDVMNATEDPRRRAFFVLRYDANRDGPTDNDPATAAPTLAERCSNLSATPPVYVGAPAGTRVGTFCQTAYVSKNFAQNNTPERLQTADQILLLEAEYLAAKGRLADADAKYRQGIQANFDYVTARGTPEGSFAAGAGAAYIASLPSLTSLSSTEAYARVVEQEYTALFARGIDGWTLVRRTGDVGRINRTLPVGTTETSLIKRIPYPQSEIDSNTNAPTQTTLTQPMFFMQSSAGNV